MVASPPAVAEHAAAILRRADLGVHRVTGVRRLKGGSKKGVYRLACADGFSAVLYVWAEAEDYWPAESRVDPATTAGGVFGHATGIGLFEACAASLRAAGVRVPRVYLVDRSQAAYPADIAVVEDVRGGTLEELLVADPRAAEPVLEQLGGMLTSMWRQRAGHIGKVGAGAVGSAGGTADRAADGTAGVGCEQLVFDRALRHLDRAATRVDRIAVARRQLEQTLRALAAAVTPRTGYALIHGELGPDHVLIDDLRRPVVVDIEGAMYFDVEWEHAFLQLRFGDQYHWLRAPGLDEHRMRLYSLALYLSLVEGPLRLLDGGYPERDGMLAIVAANVERALAMAGTAEH